MILVTGASGFVGRSLMRELAERGLNAKAYEGLINDPLRVREQLAGAHTVFHLASAKARGRPSLLQHVDVEGTEQLVKESQRAGVEHLIVMSCLEANPNSIYPLLRARGRVEQLVRSSPVPHTIVRSADLFGLEDRFLNVIAALAAWTWPFVWLPGGGEVPLQPLWVEDLVECLLQIPERPDLRNETAVVAGEERFHYHELTNIVVEAAGMRRLPLKMDLRLVRPITKLTMGWWRKPPVTPYFLNRFSVPSIAPIDSVLRTFDFRPQRLIDHVVYLRRPGHHRRLFR